MRTRRRGFTLVELMTMLAIVAIIAAFAVPNLLKARMAMRANENSTVSNLRMLMSAQVTYMSRYGVYTDFAGLLSERLIDSSLATGKKSGYRFGALKTWSDFAYCFCAIPVNDGQSGDKEYCVTQAGTIYEADLDSSGMTVEDVQWWVPSKNGTPSEFTINPADCSDVWEPVKE